MDFRQLTVAITAACFLAMGLQSTASASVIGTAEYLSAESRAGYLADINAALSRADVQAQLVALGVNPTDAASRAASLSDTELAQVAAEMQTLPAGGDGVLVVIGIVFIVLLILELTGVINIFSKF
ncbi:MAG: PA2779 family protein [Gammaproteobacteria bacterium]